MKAIEDGAGALSIMLTGLVIGRMGTVGTQRLTEADLFPESREDREWRGEPEDEDRNQDLCTSTTLHPKLQALMQSQFKPCLDRQEQIEVQATD
ncbi:unnamed protein product [Boreogadus saida]